MRVLIADSDSETGEELTSVLTLCVSDIEIFHTTSGKQCINIVNSEHPDVVILGICLSDMYCYSVISELREISEVPIIIISYKKDGEEIERCLKIGANDYMVKPVKEIELVARIKKLMTDNKNIEARETIDTRKQNTN